MDGYQNRQRSCQQRWVDNILWIPCSTIEWFPAAPHKDCWSIAMASALIFGSARRVAFVAVYAAKITINSLYYQVVELRQKLAIFLKDAILSRKKGFRSNRRPRNFSSYEIVLREPGVFHPTNTNLRSPYTIEASLAAGPERSARSQTLRSKVSDSHDESIDNAGSRGAPSFVWISKAFRL